MATSNATPQINFDEIKAKVSGMSAEDRAKKLLEFRTRQLTQQKKQQSKGGQALYNKKRNEEYKQMKALALETPASNPAYKNLWEEINATADAKAEEAHDKWMDEQLQETEPAVEE